MPTQVNELAHLRSGEAPSPVLIKQQLERAQSPCELHRVPSSASVFSTVSSQLNLDTPAPPTRLFNKGPIECSYDGMRLLNLPHLNKGSAFPQEEREQFGLSGLLPSKVCTLKEQTDRAYRQFQLCPNDLAKNAFCTSLKTQNEVLYYKFLYLHIKEVFPIIYTPTQGEAIEKYSHQFRRPEGCFLDISYNTRENVENRLAAFGGTDDIDYICVTDSEGILGIGDQGVGGIGISIAKLVLMTLCAGVHPNRVIPVVLDVGTNNKKLLDDPLYMGNRFDRVSGAPYDEFIDHFIQSVKKLFPKATLHFEDFGLSNARRILDKYKTELACFNDDIQGTGAVSVSAITAGLKVLNKKIIDTKIIIFGAGSAGMGIADEIVANIRSNGKSYDEAVAQIILMDRPGLLTTDLLDTLSPAQKPFAVDPSEWKGVDTKSLESVISHFHPNVLIGCSTLAGGFKEAAIREMAKHVERPIILPLSNPNRLAEAVPADLYKWTNDRALVATGSVFPPIEGKTTSQNNNCFSYPGIGLGAVLARAKLITDNMIAASVEALAAQAPILRDPTGGLLPEVENIHEISARVATGVVLQAVKDGVATAESELKPNSTERVKIPRDYDSCYKWVKSQMWMPEYRPLVRVGDSDDY
ncbi:malic-domain-containing protein [Nadsonia fulvescens var. elongata DSM 6958]|uniref:Malic-domain-containing protein n=1 Tax=Nadsonia fulvescens var. elongata DSM 6958 TaxID=857566 RepID=A0A1E3PII7_9ASCO|nr:malic-domain-containing protein [Nadsonia fulvescens var. elongata DSM 6958]